MIIMKKTIIALVAALTFTGSAIAQDADPFINVVAAPITLVELNPGQLDVTAANFGLDDIAQNSVEITITIGTNATITGVAAGSSAKWTQTSLTLGSGNTIKLVNSTGTIFSQEATTVLLTIMAMDDAGTGNISASVAYLAGTNPLLPGNAANSSQGNTQLNNDNSSTTLSVTPLLPLPIKLLSFNGRADECNAVISWESSEAATIESFVVESSADGSRYNAVQQVAVGKGDERSAYSVRIAQNESRMLYRLRMNAKDGTSTYSAIVAVSTSCRNMPVKLYPSPTKGAVTITGLSGGESVRFYNVLGQPVLNAVGTSTVFITDISALPAGQYRVVIRNKDQTIATIPVMKAD